MTIPSIITCTQARSNSPEHDGFWVPPTYRVTFCHQRQQCSGEQEPIVLPEAFIPPRHCFSRPSKNAEGSRPSGPSILKSSENTALIWGLEAYDIVCGRGAPSKSNTGNQVFRDLIQLYQTSYICSKRSDKPRIAKEVLQKIRLRGGRFVKRDTTTNGRAAWTAVGEQQAYEKVCQALRDGAPELRRQMVACSSIRSHNNNNSSKENSRSNSRTFQHVNVSYSHDDRDKENYTPIACW
jgi:hypothetical protein